MTELATLNPPTEMEPLPPWLRSLTNALMREGDEWSLPRSMVPTTGQKAAIANRLSVLKSQLVCDGTNDKALAVELARMLSAFPASRTDEQSLRLRMEAYFEALDGVPVWAVSAARMAALRGEGDCDPRFAPTPTQVSLLARKRLQAVRDEIAVLTRLQHASAGYEEPALAEQERVNRGFAELKACMSPEPEEKSPEQALLDLCASAGVDPDSIPNAPPRDGALRKVKAA